MEQYWQTAINTIDDLINGFIKHSPNMLLAVLVFAATYYGSSKIHQLTLRLLAKQNIKLSARNIIANIASIVVIIGGAFLVLSIMNLDDFLKAMLGAAGIAGLAVSLALQSTLSNTFAGIILSFIKSVKIGDWVDSNGYSGEILDINMRVTTLLLPDGNQVTIPNKMVIENTLKNYSLSEDSYVIVTCGVDYESDLEYVQKLVTDSVRNELDDYLPETKIIFFYYDFQENSINFELRFRAKSTKTVEIAIAKGNAIKLIHKKFRQHNINIPYPIRVIKNMKKLEDNSWKIENENENK
ncbi:MAG: mechanosensitive ion channel [Capnocytophaga sp.]|nr:mechanosensitive ion channel [Capnocytophaga sp.]